MTLVVAFGDLEAGDLEAGDLEAGDLEAGDFEAGDFEAGDAVVVEFGLDLSTAVGTVNFSAAFWAVVLLGVLESVEVALTAVDLVGLGFAMTTTQKLSS